MNKTNLIALATTFLVSMTSAHAETEKSITAELPTLTLAFEIGVTTTPEDYLAVSVYAGPDEVYGAGVNWTHSVSANKSHWLGLGAGHMSGDDDNFVISFDVGSYGSLDYKYFINGLQSNGFYFNTSLRFSDGDVFPWLGFGYNY